jgi:hypothetical protein
MYKHGDSSVSYLNITKVTAIVVSTKDIHLLLKDSSSMLKAYTQPICQNDQEENITTKGDVSSQQNQGEPYSEASEAAQTPRAAPTGHKCLWSINLPR